MTAFTDELQQLKVELLAELKNTIAPMIEKAAQSAVVTLASSVNPALGTVAALAAPPIFDAVDTLVSGLVGKVIPSNAVQAPSDPESRLAAVEHHVAALTVATNQGNSALMPMHKAVAAALSAASADPQPPAEN